MANKWWLGAIGLVWLTGGCAGEQVSQSPSVSADGQTSVTASHSPQASESAADTLPSVTVPASPDHALTVPNLIPPTASAQRSPQIAAGRSDPFAAVADTPAVVTSVTDVSGANSSAGSAPAAATNQAASAVPTVRVAAVPFGSGVTSPSVVVPASIAPAASEAGLMPTAPVAAPTSIASAITVSGIVQAGDRTSAIVQVPTESTSRSVSVGDYLANGRVLVKRIETAANTEPVVILEQNGVEVTRSVGSGNPSGLL